jgi:putative PIG3 family NAD(P)H quinone oxidoreductase
LGNEGDEMKAIRIQGRGGPDVLQMQEVEEPAPGPDEVLVDVRATALNRADLLQCLGVYPAPAGVPADIPGLEYAGMVAAVGSRVARWKPGDRVMGLVGGGGFAERLVAHERECLPIPPEMDFDKAAAVPEAFLTSFDALVPQGGLRPGEYVLIHAVGSGVGTAATQIAAALGSIVLGTSRSQAKLQRCERELGLSHPILAGSAPPFFEPRVKEITGRWGIDLAVELVGGDYFRETIASLASRGRILLIGLLGGAEVAVDLRLLLSKRAQVIGTVLRSRPIEEKIVLARSFEHQMLPLFRSGQLRPVVDSAFKATQVQLAFARMASNESFGKVVLEW